jgi:type I restriction enzyme S subunit
MKFKPYGKYKDSGIKWLGEVPEHWDVSKLRYVFSFGKGLTITKANLQDKGIPCVNYGEIHSKYGFEVDASKHDLKYVDESYLISDRSSFLSMGDFIFADTSEDLEGAGNFTHVSSQTKLFAGYHTVIARQVGEQSFRFLAYLIDSETFRTQIRLAVKGVKVFSITQAILRASLVWLPKVSEQQAIANFLDRETTRIDSLIKEKENFISLLKEKRQALISHAVTKGLDPTVKMKDSGVEWLGGVPEHWDVTSMKYIVELGPKKENIKGNLKCSFVPMKKLRTDSILLDEHQIVADVEDGYTFFKDEDILMAKVTPCFENKNIAVAKKLTNKIGFGSSEIYVFRMIKKNSNRYLYYRLQEDKFMSIAKSSMTGTAGLKRVPAEMINNFTIAVPSTDEQKIIANSLDKKTKKIDSLVKETKTSIELLKEHRTALISAAVTGKIDVRNFEKEVA